MNGQGSNLDLGVVPGVTQRGKEERGQEEPGEQGLRREARGVGGGRGGNAYIADSNPGRRGTSKLLRNRALVSSSFLQFLGL